ncbi:hypothetical protein [Rhodanobacter lindaniclasticus]
MQAGDICFSGVAARDADVVTGSAHHVARDHVVDHVGAVRMKAVDQIHRAIAVERLAVEVVPGRRQLRQRTAEAVAGGGDLYGVDEVGLGLCSHSHRVLCKFLSVGPLLVHLVTYHLEVRDCVADRRLSASLGYDDLAGVGALVGARLVA